MTNRVAITKAISLRSVNGPSFTTIKGVWNAFSANGSDAVRCAYVGTNVFLSGFTFTHGATKTNGDYTLERSGGGVWCTTNAMVSNCVFSGNSASYYGGGAYRGTLNNCTFTSNSAFEGGGAYTGALNNCTLSGNSASDQGGGSYASTLNNCTLTGNFANSGGGSCYGTLKNCTLTGNSAFDGNGGASCYGTLNDCTLAGNFAKSGGGGSCYSTLNNCTLTGNSANGGGGGSYVDVLNNCTLFANFASYNGGGSLFGTLNNCTLLANSVTYYGGGSSDGTLNNCIIYYNTAALGEPNYHNSLLNNSCTTPMPTNGTGNIVNDPAMVNASHLGVNSPCIGAGNASHTFGTDIDGESWAIPPSIGCDEVHAGTLTGALGVAITASYTNITPSIAVDFTASVTGRVTVHIWDFGDGTITSNRPYVSHAFAPTGVYSVVLTAMNESNPGGVSTTTRIFVVTRPVHYVNVLNSEASHILRRKSVGLTV